MSIHDTHFHDKMKKTMKNTMKKKKSRNVPVLLLLLLHVFVCVCVQLKEFLGTQKQYKKNMKDISKCAEIFT